jgi:hypothetical protein
MTTRPLAHYAALTVTLLVVVLGAANWYDRPERAAAWITAMLVLPVGWGLAWLAGRRTVRTQGETAARQGRGAIRSGIIFGGLIVLTGLAETLLAGWIGREELLAGLDERATMVLVGAYLVVTGNTMPKTLVPLASMQCDGARMQAFQRTAGWIWVMSGLTFAIAWIVLPVAVARPVSLSVIASGILIVATLALRLHLAKRRPLTAGPDE